MNKLLKVLLILFTIFISIVSVQFIIKTINSNEKKEIKETHMTSEQMEVQTMTTISDIVLNQLLENVILNIDLSQNKKGFDVVLYLQANEFISEDTLLKDSYNLLIPIQQVKTIHDFTIKWHMLVKNKNTEVLILSFNEDTIATIEKYSYMDLTQLATTYVRHKSLH
ncbi:MAG: hypothetical protein ABS944_00005 [Solibacillus sp.]|uniref:hypothetical protein n=1 Tax=unclassified Solibacillus TaxID=2637870 RepID=UPI0030F7D2A4